MRVLHARARHGGARPARPQPGARPTSSCARRSPATCAAARATAASSHGRCGVAARQRRGDPVTDARRRHRRHAPRRRHRARARARPDGVPRCAGEFAFSSDLWADGMLWGARAALAAPAGAHPLDRHRPRAGDRRRARRAHRRRRARRDALTASSTRDQPVFARDVVRYHGEPVAAVAADHPDTARRALRGDRRRLRAARPARRRRGGASTRRPIHPDGNVFRHLVIRHGDADGRGRRSSSRAPTRSACRTRRSWAPSPGWRSPTDDGGVDLHVSTQWLHVDRDQVADVPRACRPSKVRLTLAGVGGAFGAREDVSLQVHVCLLALHTGRPVKMVLHPRGVVPRPRAPPPGAHCTTATTPTATARSSRSRRRIVLDGGAYARRAGRVAGQRLLLRGRPVRRAQRADRGLGGAHQQPAVRRDARLRRGAGRASPTRRRWTSWPPRCGIDPVELRLRNAMATGDRCSPAR